MKDERVPRNSLHAFRNNLNFGGAIPIKTCIDGIIKRPTIRVDGKVIAEKGSLLLR